ncbi:hypothetical protein BDZ90DRAFT_226016 [Jaminaea rosea]|uniref:Uncharacterized protein n=1 Tax=Jaminaea rosea TaxID=1569628 RepID=A0A316UWW4_9BASI|nr:hypothetical protein BDZ90DRAFT_226016 [Jaminaea rosea]PWN29779.1 hypothetical protein BDZ90DRAFT_226016 [Jaminaea rosea]
MTVMSGQGTAIAGAASHSGPSRDGNMPPQRRPQHHSQGLNLVFDSSDLLSPTDSAGPGLDMLPIAPPYHRNDSMPSDGSHSSTNTVQDDGRRSHKPPVLSSRAPFGNGAQASSSKFSPALPSSGSVAQRGHDEVPMDADGYDHAEKDEVLQASGSSRWGPAGIGGLSDHHLSMSWGRAATRSPRAPPTDVPSTPVTAGLYSSQLEQDAATMQRSLENEIETDSGDSSLFPPSPDCEQMANHDLLSATLRHLKGRKEGRAVLDDSHLEDLPLEYENDKRRVKPASRSPSSSADRGADTPTATNLRERRLLAHRRGSSGGSAPPSDLPAIRTDVTRVHTKPVRPPRSERRSSISTSEAQSTSRPTNRPRLSHMETPNASDTTLSARNQGEQPTWEAKVRAWKVSGHFEEPTRTESPPILESGYSARQPLQTCPQQPHQPVRESPKPYNTPINNTTLAGGRRPSAAGPQSMRPPLPRARTNDGQASDYLRRPFIWAGNPISSASKLHGGKGGDSVEDLADPSLLYACPPYAQGGRKGSINSSSGSLQLLSPNSRSRSGSIAGSESSHDGRSQRAGGGWSEYAHSNNSAVSQLQIKGGAGGYGARPSTANSSQTALVAPAAQYAAATSSPSATSSSNFSSGSESRMRMRRMHDESDTAYLVRQGLALTEDDVEVSELRSVEQHSSLFGIRRRLVSTYPDLGAGVLRSALPSRRSSRRSSSFADDEENRPSWTRMESEKSLRKAEEKLEAREADLTIEAVSKHEATSVSITVWTEQREGRWTVRGPAPPGVGVANRLPDIGDVWLIPIDSRGIVERKKLRSNIEMASSRTVVVCSECVPARARGIDMNNCRVCKGAGCVEKVFIATVTIRVATFLPLKLPSIHLIGARLPQLTYIEAEDELSRTEMLQDRAIESTLQACRRVGQQHNLQHDARLLMTKAKVERKGVMTVSVASSRSGRKRVFEVVDHAGKITEQASAPRRPSTSASRALTSASTTSLGSKKSFESTSGSLFGRRPSGQYASHTMPRMGRQGSHTLAGSLYSRGGNASTSSTLSTPATMTTAPPPRLTRPKLKTSNSEIGPSRLRRSLSFSKGPGSGAASGDDGDSDIFGSGGTFGERTREPSPTESPALDSDTPASSAAGIAVESALEGGAEVKRGRLRSLFRKK